MFELLEKPSKYEKDKNKKLFDRFNKKLEEYNSLVNQNAPDNLKIALLQEIDFFLQNLQLKISDPNLRIPDTPCLREIMAWDMSKALEQLNISSLPGLPREKQLFDKTTDAGSLMTEKEWLDALKDSKVEIVNAVGMDLKNHTQLTDNIDKYYSLKQIQTKLLTAINEQELDKDDLETFRKLSLQINTDLSNIIKHTPELNKRYEEHAFLADDLREQVKKLLSSKEELALALEKHGKEGRVNEEDLRQNLEKIRDGDKELINIIVQFGMEVALPGHYQSTLLSKANNMTWKITDKRTNEDFTIRIEKPLRYPLLVNKLSQSDVNEYFSQDYTTYFSTNNIVVSEYAVKKDMRSNRKDSIGASNNDLIKGATKDLGQIVDLSKKLLENGAMHSDIKLSNFLLHGDGSMFITDKKALIPISPDGKINTKDINTTIAYAPPEYRQIVEKDIIEDKDINAEQFMSYQIGLALYEHLVFPESEDKPGVKFWTEQSLDFSAEVFKSPLGLKMQQLIEKATKENPEERIGLKDFHRELENIRLQSQQEQLQEQLETSVNNLAEYKKDYEQRYKKKYGETQEPESIKGKKIKLATTLFSIIQSSDSYLEKAKALEDFIKAAPQELKHKNILHRLTGGSEFTLVKMAKEMLDVVTKLHEAEASLSTLEEKQEKEVSVQQEPEFLTPEQDLLLSLDEISLEDLEKYSVHGNEQPVSDSSKGHDSKSEEPPIEKREETDTSLILNLSDDEISQFKQKCNCFKERLTVCKKSQEIEEVDETESLRQSRL